MSYERATLPHATGAVMPDLDDRNTPLVHSVGRRASSTSLRWMAGMALWIPVVAATLWQEGIAGAVFGRVAGPSLLIIAGFTAAGAGRRIRRLFNIRDFGKLDSLCLDVAVGWAALGLGLTLLATCRLLLAPVVAVMSMLLFLVFGLGTKDSTSGWSAWSEVPWRGLARMVFRRRECRIPFLLMMLLWIDALLWAAGPVWDWDSEMYHLPCARFLVEHHGLAVSTSDPLMNIPGQMYVWYASGMFCGHTAFASLLMWGATILTSLLAASFAARRIGATVALWTIPVFWSGAIVTAVAITPRVEPFCALMFMAALILLDRALCGSGMLRLGPFVLAGLCLGSAGASKYQALYGWPIVGGWLAWVWVSDRRLRNMRSLAAGMLLFSTAILVNAPWWGKNLLEFANPFYPALAQGDPSSLTHAQSFEPGRPAGVWSFLKMTLNVFLTPNAFNGAPNHFPHYLFVLFPLVLLIRPPRAVAWLAGISAGYYVLSMSLTPNTRYLFPIFGAFSICTAYVMVYLAGRMQMRIVFPGVTALSIAFSLLIPARTLTTPALLGYLAGSISEGDFLGRMSGSGFHETTSWINERTPPDAVILMCWDARQFRIRRQTVIDPAYSTWSVLFQDGRSTPEEVSRFLHSRDIDYVLVNEGALAFNVVKSKRITEQARLDFERQRDALVGRALDPVLVSRSVTLYRVLGPRQTPGGGAVEVSHGG